MTQSEATPPPQPPQKPQVKLRRLSRKPKTGALVRLAGTEQTGTVVESDDWMDTLKLRGVATVQQTLVEWPGDLRTWEQLSALEEVPAPAAEVLGSEEAAK